jgi:hypothetical protein
MGHRQITRAAMDRLAETPLAWLAEMAPTVEAAAVQPDLMRPGEMPSLRRIEAPRHFLDREVLGDRALPATLSEYLRLLTEIAESEQGGAILRPGGDVSQIGILPYAVEEDTQRLAAIFAQLRHRPADPFLRSLAALQAGFLAHYAQDMCQPLHTSIHHDGRARADLSSPHSGLHRQVDDLIGRLDLGPVDESPRRALVPLFEQIRLAFGESHSWVDRVYELEPAIRKQHEGGSASRELEDFVRQRRQRAVDLTADLVLTAWSLAEQIEVAEWARTVDAAAGAAHQRRNAADVE